MPDRAEPTASGPPLPTQPQPANPARRLFVRLSLINGLLFSVGTLVLALSPATVSAPVLLLEEVPILLVGLLLILIANALLVRASLAPLATLSTLMQRVDLLRGEERLPEQGTGDLRRLVTTFNAMLDRLTTERQQSAGETLTAQEHERERIARELHDEIGQNLTVVLLGLKHTIDRAPDPLHYELDQLQQSVRHCAEQVRQVARRLRPGELAELGLRSALISLGNEFTKISGIPVDKAITREPIPLGRDAELVIYRIAQESLTNVLRHAHAHHVRLELTQTEHAQRLRIIDDGPSSPIREGTGIRGMRERAALIQAHLSIHPAEAGGTEVCLHIPTTPNGNNR